MAERRGPDPEPTCPPTIASSSKREATRRGSSPCGKASRAGARGRSATGRPRAIRTRGGPGSPAGAGARLPGSRSRGARAFARRRFAASPRSSSSGSLEAPPSRRALEELAGQGPALAAAGVPVLALSVDKADREAEVREAVVGPGVPAVLAGDEMAGTYSMLQPVPVRPPGGSAAAHPAPVERTGRGRQGLPRRHCRRPPSWLTSRSSTRPPAERLARATPFPGILRNPAFRAQRLPVQPRAGRAGLRQGLARPASGAWRSSTRAPSPSTTSGPWP